MSKVAHARRSWGKLAGAIVATAGMVVVAGCSGGSGASSGSSGGEGEEVTIEFAQWWAPELPDGAFQELIDGFEADNPGINVELISGPYASTKEQLFSGAATGTMPDVVGLDGVWVNDFVNQGVIADLSGLMTEAGYDDSELASQIQIDGKTYMIPVVNFIYPMFYNNTLLEEAGVTESPTTRTEFAAAANAVAEKGSAAGWVLPLSLETPNAMQNDIMSWVWANDGSMMADGMPDLTNDDVKGAYEYIKGLWDDGVIAPGAFNLKEQDKVEEFTNERVAMMISSLAHINLIRENNPDLDFSVSAIPAEDDYSGERGIPYASWGIGIAEGSENKDAAFKLVEYLMSKDTNAKLSSIANAFPGNTESVPDFVEADELFQDAFDIYQEGFPANEFVGLPVAEQLMRLGGEQFQLMLDGKQSVDEALDNTQEAWTAEF